MSKSWLKLAAEEASSREIEKNKAAIEHEKEAIVESSVDGDDEAGEEDEREAFKLLSEILLSWERESILYIIAWVYRYMNK